MAPLPRSVVVALGCVVGVVASFLAPTPADARTFEVSIRVFCPASWNTVTNVLDPTFTTVAQVPCAGIRVVAMDADPLWDEYCGAGYTDSRGIARFTAECGDTINPDPEVYVKVEGRSINGFSVGVPDVSLWQKIRDSTLASLTGGATMPLYVVNTLREHQTFQWLSPEFQVMSATLDLGDWQIGASFSDGTVSTMAARQFWAAHHTMLRLRAGTQYRAMDFNYTVSAPIGTPTTLYDTVILSFTNNGEPAASSALQSTSHEIGHVLYNTYHSGMLHWLYEDASDYMTNHGPCDTDHFQTLAWYEGFADFIQDYVLQRWNWPASNWTAAWRPFRGCAIDAMDMTVPGLQDLHIEGNVQGMLNNIFYGPIRQTQRIAVGQPAPADYTCPVGRRRVVNAAGVVQCEREVPATCTGTLEVDGVANIDQCVRLVPNSSCSGGQVCEPVELTAPTSCGSGSPLRRPGLDACIVTSPATHSLGNATPAPRPDGTPDLTIGRDPAGVRAWFSLPDLDTVMDWVTDAGTDGHRAGEFWDGWIRPWCVAAPAGTHPHYCDPDSSATFLGELQTLDPGLN